MIKALVITLAFALAAFAQVPIGGGGGGRGLPNCTTEGDIPKLASGVWACAEDSGASSGAPTAAPYVMLANDATTTTERVLAVSAGICATDGGANNNLTFGLCATGLSQKATPVAADRIVALDSATSNTPVYVLPGDLPAPGSSGQVTFNSSGKNAADGGLSYDFANDHLGVSQKVTVGQSSVASGQVCFNGLTSGVGCIVIPDIAGTPTITLPTSDGTLALAADVAAKQDAATAATDTELTDGLATKADTVHSQPDYTTYVVTDITDEFGSATEQDIKTGGDGAKSNGWYVLNSANADAIDVNTTNAGQLTIDHGATATGTTTFTLPFVYKLVSGNFDVEIDLTASNHNQQAEGVLLVARDESASAGEDYVEIRQYYTGGNQQVLVRNITNGSTTSSEAFITNERYLRMSRIGDVFTLYSRASEIVAWTQRAQYTRDDFAIQLQLGIGAICSITSDNFVAQIDYVLTALPGVVATAIKDTGSSILIPSAPPADATLARWLFEASMVGGSSIGTYIGGNPAAFLGDFINWQINDVSVFKVDYEGNITYAGELISTSADPYNLTALTQPTPPGAHATANTANVYLDRTSGRWSWHINGEASARAALTTADFLTNTLVHAFGEINDMSCANTTMTVTGAAVGDPVSIGSDPAPAAGLTPSAQVSAADTVRVQMCNLSGGAVTPASTTFKVSVAK